MGKNKNGSILCMHILLFCLDIKLNSNFFYIALIRIYGIKVIQQTELNKAKNRLYLL